MVIPRVVLSNRWLLSVSILIALIAAIAATSRGDNPSTEPATQPATAPAIKVDMDKALAVVMPEVREDLKPAEFKTPDDRAGWLVRIPGKRPIATPAYAHIDGRGVLFVGGGYGSHEFYAFDAGSGEVKWKINTADDGPTAAVVEDDCVAFNTESCTVIVVEARTGKLVWQEWLGDPLMSQPAIYKGRLFMAYPGGNPRGAQTDANVQRAAQNGGLPADGAGKHNTGPAKGNGHRLLCADLKTGKHLWEQDIAGDIISAPVIDGDRAYLTCFDGTSYCIDSGDGNIIWQKKDSGTSAPIVADGQLITTQKQGGGGQIVEGIRRLDLAKGESHDKDVLAGGKAEYLRTGNAGSVALSTSVQKAQDSTVGFAAAPAAANLAGANTNVNVATVSGAWAYQGSRAAYANGNVLNAQGDAFNCVNAKTGKVAWRAEAVGSKVDHAVQSFAPPALGKNGMFICSTQGHLIALDQKTGATRFIYSTGLPMAFQPALAEGNIYAGTSDGMLLCLKTGDADADGWTAWGGNAQHNKKQ